MAMADHGVTVALLATIFALGVVAVSSVRDLEVDGAPMVTLHQTSRPRARKLVTGTVWCVAKANLSDTALQGSLDWVCGPQPDQGQVNCGPLQSGGACFSPDTASSHASWAFNAYFQSHNASDSACDFQGTAMQVTVDPSTATCSFPGSLKEVNGTIANGTIAPPPPGIFTPTAAAASTGFEPHYLFSVSAAFSLVTYLLT